MKWPLVPLAKVVEVESGFGFPREHQGGEQGAIPFFKVSDMNLPKNSREMCEWNNSISPETLDKLKARTFPAGTVIFPKIGAAIATGKKRRLIRDATFDNNVMGLVPTKVDSKFLYYWALHFDFTAISNIGPVPSIRKTTVEGLLFPLPPPKEQRRVVELLEQADRLRRQRTEADNLADRILAALFHKMFGDPATNPKGWAVVPLKELGLPWSGGAFPLDEQGERAGEVPFIKVSDMNLLGNERFIRSANHWVSRDTLTRLSVKPAPAGTIVFPKIGAAIATNKKRVLARETAFDNNVQGVVPRRPEDSLFLFGFFQLFDLTRLARTTALPSIRPSELAELPIIVPAPQRREEFGKLYSATCGVLDRQGTAHDELEKLFQVMLHRAFTGELTAKWREAHMKELLAEMEHQARLLKSPTEELALG